MCFSIILYSSYTAVKHDTNQTLRTKNYFDLVLLEENIMATPLLVLGGGFFSASEEPAVECLTCL